MKKERGTLASWNDDKGYGFIRPHNGSEDIFLHVKSLPHYQRRPKAGDILTYEVGIDENQKPYVSYAKIDGIAWSPFTIIWLGITLLFGIYVYFVIRRTVSFHPLAIYAAMSLLTIQAYSRDKGAAQSGKWRISELRLHLFEILGGWPGALLAQLYYRHKSRKISYQIVFWTIVVSHCVLWYFFLTHQEMYRTYQRIVTEKFRSFVNRSEEHIPSLSKRVKLKDALTGSEHKKRAEQAETGSRSIIISDRKLRIVKGVVKEIRPQEGVIVSLQSGTKTYGIIDKSTLTDNFSTRFAPGEHVQVAIHTVKMKGNSQYIYLILVENRD